MIKTKQIAGFEDAIKGTSRSYTEGQGSSVVVLSVIAGKTDYDLDDSNKFYLDLDADSELQLPTNDRGQDVAILVKNAGGFTLTFHASYNVVGDTPSTTDGDFILLNISCWGSSGTPWVVVNNQP